MAKIENIKLDGISKEETLLKLGNWADCILNKMQDEARKNIKEKNLSLDEEVEFAVPCRLLDSFKFYIKEEEYSAKDLFIAWLSGMTLEDFLDDISNGCFIEQVVDEFGRENLED